MGSASGPPFDLREPPFAAAPDPRFACLSGAAGEVLERLQHTIAEGDGGILLLSGGNGSGKTLLAQCLLERLADRDVRVARILHSRVTPIELLQSVCTHLRVPLGGADRNSGRDLVNALSAFLMDIYAQGQRVLLVVDEAQNLPDESLEQLRLLTNLETPAHKLIHILMLATPLLRERLHAAALRPLAQRIAAWYELPELNAEESEAYVRHRLQVAGAERSPFSRLALRDMYRASRGVPRLLNLIGERALALAVERKASVIGERIVQQAARDALPGHVGYWLRRYRWWFALAVVVLAALAGILVWNTFRAKGPEPAVATLAARGVSANEQAQQVVQSLPLPRQARLQAWSELLARWQVGSDQVGVEQASQCQAVIFAGFDCVGGTGTLDQLRRFDRPLILVLDTPKGASQVVLLGVGEKRVRLDVGPRDVEISRPALAQLWHGQFYAPFRLPASLPAVMRLGDTGPGVAWLDRRLRQSDGVQAPAQHPARFDQALQERVRRLQRVFGIPDDGVVGPETLFALTSLSATGPRLARHVP